MLLHYLFLLVLCNSEELYNGCPDFWKDQLNWRLVSLDGVLVRGLFDYWYTRRARLP